MTQSGRKIALDLLKPTVRFDERRINNPNGWLRNLIPVCDCARA